MENKKMIPQERILNKIVELRGEKVMLDRDLALLYGVKTKVLKQAVGVIPNAFLQILFWNDKNGIRELGLCYAPFCFTESGVTMLSCMLNSQRAIEVNTSIISAFSKMRELLLNDKKISIYRWE